MLYVSAQKGERYCVIDTDDGHEDWLNKRELLGYARLLKSVGVVINGVSGNSVSIIDPSGVAMVKMAGVPFPVLGRVVGGKAATSEMDKFVERARALGILGAYAMSPGREKLLQYNGRDLEVVIPPVRVIGKECFYSYAHDWVKPGEVVTIDMPSTVEVIEDRAFAGLSLTRESRVRLENVRSIGVEAFSGVVAPDSIVFELPRVQSIGERAFAGCKCGGIVISSKDIHTVPKSAFSVVGSVKVKKGITILYDK